MPLPNIGLPELIIILVIALLVIGPGKLPEVGTALGKSIREFRKAASDVQDAAKLDVTPAVQPPAPYQPAASVAAQTAPAVAAAAAPVAPPTAPEAVPVVTTPAAPDANVLSGQATPNEIGSEPKA